MGSNKVPLTGFWVAGIFDKDMCSKFYAWVSWHRQKHERKQIELKQGTIEVIKKFSVEMLSSWCNPGLWDLYGNAKWQTVMAEPTSDCQLPRNLSVTRGIQSDIFSSMTAVLVGSLLFPPNLQLYPLSFPERPVSIKGQEDLLHCTVLFTCNPQQVFWSRWI